MPVSKTATMAGCLSPAAARASRRRLQRLGVLEQAGAWDLQGDLSSEGRVGGAVDGAEGAGAEASCDAEAADHRGNGHVRGAGGGADFFRGVGGRCDRHAGRLDGWCQREGLPASLAPGGTADKCPVHRVGPFTMRALDADRGHEEPSRSSRPRTRKGAIEQGRLGGCADAVGIIDARVRRVNGVPMCPTQSRGPASLGAGGRLGAIGDPDLRPVAIGRDHRRPVRAEGEAARSSGPGPATLRASVSSPNATWGRSTPAYRIARSTRKDTCCFKPVQVTAVVGSRDLGSRDLRADRRPPSNGPGAKEEPAGRDLAAPASHPLTYGKRRYGR